MTRSFRSHWLACLALGAAAVLAPGVRAHRLDEFLQATRIALASDAVTL